MKILVALAVCFGLSVYAKDRAPNQVSPYPGLPTTPSTPVSTPTGTFNSEDVMAAGPQVAQVLCIVNGSSPYTLSAVYGNDVRVARVASAGAISYEVYKGQKFVGACPAIQVISR